MPTVAANCSERRCVSLRPAGDADLEFLFSVYAGTRHGELAVTAWSDEQKEQFLRMQFALQHDYYRRTYLNATFEVILVDNVPAGRLYREERDGDIRIIDIALLPIFRGAGIGSRLMTDILGDADRRGRSVSLHVERNNPVLGYYGRLGFRVGEDRGVYLFMVRPPGAGDSCPLC
jgi:ribosomal protein S18 acetylase RimI-like enzyme